jgi:hypothetical protein
MKISILTVALMLGSPAGVVLADSLPPINPPSMVGTWKSTSDVGAARLGAAVAGYELFADKSKEPFVGVFKHSGQLLISTNRGIATVECAFR